MGRVNWSESIRRIFARVVKRRRLTRLGSLSAARLDELHAFPGINERLGLRPHPLNAPGPFYSVDEGCVICGTPHAAAPELMAWYENTTGTGCLDHCFFRRQPETHEEVRRAINAMEVSCVENLRYGGKDPAILKVLSDAGLRHLCDAFED